MKNLFLRTRVNSTIILTAVTTIDVFLPKTTVIFAQGDTEAGTVGISDSPSSKSLGAGSKGWPLSLVVCTQASNKPRMPESPLSKMS